MRTYGRRLPEAGFTLLETVVAVTLVGLVLASAAVTFVGATSSAAALQRHQAAVRLAGEALALARSASLEADADGCVPLLAGRTGTAVTAQWAAPPSGLDLAATDPATTPATCTAAAVVPLVGLRTGPGSAVVDPVVVGGQTYTVRTYVGTCRLPVAGGDCLSAATVGALTATTVYRVVAAVTWTAPRGCPGGCSYSASTLLDPSGDPPFDTRRSTPSAPRLLVAEPADGSLRVGWTAPASAGDSPLLGYVVTVTPSSGGAPVTVSVGPAATSATVTGLTDGLTYLVTVVARNALGTGQEARTTGLPYPADVMSPSRLAWWLDAADLDSLTTDAAGGTPVTGAGQPVRRWKDRSGRGNDATVRSGRQAPSTVTGSGRTVPDWNGVDTCLEASAADLPHGTDLSTTFVVATAADPVPAAAPYRQVVSWGTHASGQARQVYKVASSAQVGADTAFGDIAKAALDWSRTTAQVAAAQHGPDAVVVWAAGQGGVSQASWTPRTTGTDAAGLGCAIWPDGSVDETWRGPIAEVVVLDGTVTASERRRVEEYLARKWSAPVTPGAPGTVVVTPTGAGGLAVAWSPPDYDGGTPPTGYTATASPGGTTCTSTTTGCVLAGLVTGQAYDVTVTATNAMGTGPDSAAVTGVAG